MAERTHFSERLRVIMAVRDVSGAELARRIGVTRAAVAPWMRGTIAPLSRQIMAIAKALDVDVSWLIKDAPVDLHGPATDDMRATLVGLFVAGVLSEGQTVRATGLDHVEVRRRAHQRIDEFYGDAAHVCPSPLLGP